MRRRDRRRKLHPNLRARLQGSIAAISYRSGVFKLEKLDEAVTFLEHMRATGDRTKFRHYLSALLSAARSVCQYMHKETESDASARAWYEHAISASPVLSFLTEVRNSNVHERLVPVAARHHVALGEQMFITESLGVVVKRADGSVDHKVDDPLFAVVPPSVSTAAVHTDFYFDGWEPQTAVELCGWFLDEIRAMVTAGVELGHVAESPEPAVTVGGHPFSA